MSANRVHEATPGTAAPPEYRPVMAWGITGMLVLFIVVNWADKTVFGIAAQPLKEDLGLTSAQIGFIGSAFFFLFSITGLAVGFIGNRVRTKWVLLALAALWSLTMVPVLVSASAVTLLISRIGLGAAEGPAGAMANAGAFEWFPKEKRSFPSAWLSSGASIAKIAIAPVLALIVAVWGWRAAFLALALIGVVWCAAWALIGREGPFSPHRSQLAAAEDPAAQQRVPFRKIAFSGTFVGGVIGTFTMYGMVSVILTWLPSYFEVGLGIDRLQAGAMFGLPSISGMTAMLVVSWISDRRVSAGSSSRVQRGIVPAVSLLIGGGLLALLPYLGSPVLAISAVVLGYGIGAVALPLANAALSQICPPRQQAGALGVFLALQTSSGLVAPALTGVLVDLAASPGAGFALAFQVFGLAVMVGGIATFLLVNPDRDAARILG
ncbi:MFS transporter [Saccharopolyspora sp. NPDC050389]|uniref:MFS transporter n=1 Tax=Saccharopolyspora sp. NPDC050389 TaxID=3155516 RepID=UPI0033F66A7C